MYNIAYFQLILKNIKDPSFLRFKELYKNKQIYQPIIFCDKYIVETNFPIFHSSYINQHFHKKLILTDFDQIKYIQNFKNQHFIVLYNQDIHTITDDKYHYISLEDNLNQFLEKNCNEYKTI